MRILVPFLIAGLGVWVMLVVLQTPAQAVQSQAPTQTLHVIGAMDPSNVQPILEDFFVQSGISTTYQQMVDSADYLLECTAQGNCPDLAIIPNAGLMKSLAERSEIQPLDAILPAFDTYYTDTWRELGSVNGQLYGLTINAGSKSMTWYRPDTFNTISATIPADWTGLLGLADEFVTSGLPPFAIGAESGAASGWPLTDIFENILTRTAGPEAHRQLAKHEIGWTDHRVVEAMERFTDIVGVEAYQAGGISGTLTTNFGDAIAMVLNEPPAAAMNFSGNWATYFADPGEVPLVDYNYFVFPEIQAQWGQPIIGGADLAVLFSSTSEAQTLMQYLATPEAGEVFVTSPGGHISPNQGVDLAVYTDPINKAVAAELVNARDFLYDLDDQLPYPLQPYVWNAMMAFVAHQDQMMAILEGIEEQATQVQGPANQNFLPILLNQKAVPAFPQLELPANNAVLDTLIPTFRWDMGVQPDGSQGCFAIGTDPHPTFCYMSFGGNTGQWERVLWYNLHPSTVYYWRVGVIENNDKENANWSEERAFTTGPDGGVILPAPVPVSPADQSPVSTVDVTLTWQPVAGAVEYDVLLHAVDADRWFGFQETSEPQLVIYDFAYLASSYGPNFEWFVTARNAYAWGDNSDAWAFTYTGAAGGSTAATTRDIVLRKIHGRTIEEIR